MNRYQRGGTLIEALVAMMVMLIGAAAMAGLHRQALFFNGDGRKLTRAAAIASDLLFNLERLPYTDPLLSNTSAANDADLVDSAHLLERDDWTIGSADHNWIELPAATWPGVTSASMAAGGTTLSDSSFQIYWNVSETIGSTFSYKQIAAIVRWPHGGGWRRMVAVGVKPGAPYIP